MTSNVGQTGLTGLITPEAVALWAVTVMSCRIGSFMGNVVFLMLSGDPREQEGRNSEYRRF